MTVTVNEKVVGMVMCCGERGDDDDTGSGADCVVGVSLWWLNCGGECKWFQYQQEL